MICFYTENIQLDESPNMNKFLYSAFFLNFYLQNKENHVTLLNLENTYKFKKTDHKLVENDLFHHHYYRNL